MLPSYDDEVFIEHMATEVVNAAAMRCNEIVCILVRHSIKQLQQV